MVTSPAAFGVLQVALSPPPTQSLLYQPVEGTVEVDLASQMVEGSAEAALASQMVEGSVEVALASQASLADAPALEGD